MSAGEDAMHAELEECLRDSADWNLALGAAGLPDAAVVSVARVRPLARDVSAHDEARAALGPAHSTRLMRYEPSSVVRDLDSILSQGFPCSGGRETVVTDGGMCFQGDALCFTATAPRSARTVLLCDVATARVLECDGLEAAIITPETLRSGGFDCASTPTRLVTYERTHALPRFVIRTLERWQSRVNDEYCTRLRVDATVEPPLAPDAAQVVHVRAGQSVQAAVDAAPAGATVVVHEGVYHEFVSLSAKSVHLVGQGRPVIAAPGSVGGATGDKRPTATLCASGPHRYSISGIVVRAAKRRVRPAVPEALSASWANECPDVEAAVRQRRAQKGVPNYWAQSHAATLVDQGRCANALEIVDAVQYAHVTRCELLGGVEVSGGSAAWISHCDVVDGIVNGVYVSGARALVEDCTVARHDSANVAVENSDAVFVRCAIWGSLSTGVYLFNRGCATLAHCDIYANAQTGIQMEGLGTNPVVRCNRIHHGEQYGMFITEKAAGVVEANHFYANVWAAVALTEAGNALVTGNVCARGYHYGLYCFDNGVGHMTYNVVHSNKDAGLAVASGGAPVVEQNEFMYGHSYGAYFFLSGRGRLCNNKLYAHRSANVCITFGSDPLVAHNRIYESQAEGVSVVQDGAGIVEHNEVYNNGECNVMLQFESNPTVRHNRLYGSLKTGVCCLHKSRGVIVDNEIFGSEFSGLAIKTAANPVVERNYIHDNKRYALLVQMGGKGTVTGNRFAANGLGSVRVWSDCPDTVVHSNAFETANEGTETRVEKGKRVATTVEAAATVPAAVVAAAAAAATTAAATSAYALLIPGERYEDFRESQVN